MEPTGPQSPMTPENYKGLPESELNQIERETLDYLAGVKQTMEQWEQRIASHGFTEQQLRAIRTALAGINEVEYDIKHGAY